ncbi:MAG: U32 family peptidase [Massilibacteroides sp.]|nr:U32 family peptidase [Massilibacteroides sp.]
MNKRKKIELLAPAKNLKTGIEAIRHGADAVYIGASLYGARSAAGNSLDDIKALCDFAHLYGVRIYVTVNTILKDEELEDVRQLIISLYASGVDALIVQDMAIQEMDIPPIPLHASTQMDNRTAEKVKFLEDVGYEQVVLARELSLKQISAIAEATTVPLEVFVHGALCVSYSGQCYLSQATCGRSANRGECAQYCRLPYDLVDAEGTIISKGKHLLSLRDMNRSQYIEDLVEAGVTSFKIEGRLKDVSYVKNVTALYRQKIDEILTRHPEYERASYGKSTLTFVPEAEKSFNRGFTSYFLKERSVDITAFNTPKSLGEPIGYVKALKGNSFTLTARKPLVNGDGIVFLNSEGELEGFRVNKVEGNRIFPLKMPASLSPHLYVYRNYNQAFEKIMAKPSADRCLALKVHLWDTPFGFALEFEDEMNMRVTVTQVMEKELANRSQEKNIIKQLSKLGNTLFETIEVKIELSKQWFIPSSILADMRRRGIERLLAAKKLAYSKNIKPRKPKKVTYPVQELTYLGNVSNQQAADFYKAHGVTQIDSAYEIKAPSHVPLMFTKHCLRYSMGWCPVHQHLKSPYKEPFYLKRKGLTLRLEFDCKNCQMLVIQEK